MSTLALLVRCILVNIKDMKKYNKGHFVNPHYYNWDLNEAYIYYTR